MPPSVKERIAALAAKATGAPKAAQAKTGGHAPGGEGGGAPSGAPTTGGGRRRQRGGAKGDPPPAIASQEKQFGPIASLEAFNWFWQNDQGPMFKKELAAQYQAGEPYLKVAKPSWPWSWWYGGNRSAAWAWAEKGDPTWKAPEDVLKASKDEAETKMGILDLEVWIPLRGTLPDPEDPLKKTIKIAEISDQVVKKTSIKRAIETILAKRTIALLKGTESRWNLLDELKKNPFAASGEAQKFKHGSGAGIFKTQEDPDCTRNVSPGCSFQGGGSIQNWFAHSASGTTMFYRKILRSLSTSSGMSGGKTRGIMGRLVIGLLVAALFVFGALVPVVVQILGLVLMIAGIYTWYFSAGPLMSRVTLVKLATLMGGPLTSPAVLQTIWETLWFCLYITVYFLFRFWPTAKIVLQAQVRYPATAIFILLVVSSAWSRLSVYGTPVPLSVTIAGIMALRKTYTQWRQKSEDPIAALGLAK